MGMVKVSLAGSFRPVIAEFCAMDGGHANAIQRAIKFLVGELPRAIQQDHELHDRGDRPPRADFGKAVD